MTDKRVLVFVYGTLKAGFPLYSSYMGQSEFVDEAVVDGFTLLNLGPYPAMIRVYGPHASKFSVAGELWLMPLKDFRKVEAMEGAAGYSCIPVPVKDTEAMAFVMAEIEEGVAEWRRVTEVLPNKKKRYSGRVHIHK